MRKSQIEKAVKAFLKDEYNLEDVDVDIKINTVSAKPQELKRIQHDIYNDFDFDLLD
jgi:hypothetical protein